MFNKRRFYMWHLLYLHSNPSSTSVTTQERHITARTIAIYNDDEKKYLIKTVN